MQGAWFRLLQQLAAGARGPLEARGHPLKTGLIQCIVATYVSESLRY